MGFMDTMKSEAANYAGGNHAELVQSVIGSFQAQGGLTGLVNTFHEKGLGGIVSSWIGTGPNQPIGANQIENVLGNDRIAALASKFGIPPATVTETIARMLPNVIDRLTPNGKLQAEPQ